MSRARHSLLPLNDVVPSRCPDMSHEIMLVKLATKGQVDHFRTDFSRNTQLAHYPMSLKVCQLCHEIRAIEDQRPVEYEPDPVAA